MQHSRRDNHETGRRIEAARALAGLKSRANLARKLKDASDDGRAPSASTIRNWETGDYVPSPDLREIARVCDLPYEFFTADLWTLSTTAPPREIESIAERLERVAERLTALAETDAPAPRAAAAALLDDAETRLAQHRAAGQATPSPTTRTPTAAPRRPRHAQPR